MQFQVKISRDQDLVNRIVLREATLLGLLSRVVFA